MAANIRPSKAKLNHKKICQNCGREYRTSYECSIWCSHQCRIDGCKKRYISHNTCEKMSTSARGSLSELKVAVDMVEKGWEVYRALSPASPCDFLILQGEKVLRLEVKTKHYTPTGSIPTTLPAYKADVLALVFPDNKIVYYGL